MDINIFNHSDPSSQKTIQIMRTTCPKCNEGVQFAVDEADRSFKSDAEHYEKRAEYYRLQVEDKIAEIKTLRMLIPNL